ncbi:MAG: InlB B-repeat-containing protein [Clostridia bacterium]|nr:InlB B-repeat-containing protein [Clostridia bacterium]
MLTKRFFALILTLAMCLCLIPEVAANALTEDVNVVDIKRDAAKTDLLQDDLKPAEFTPPLSDGRQDFERVLAASAQPFEISGDAPADLTKTYAAPSGEFSVNIRSDKKPDPEPVVSAVHRTGTFDVKPEETFGGSGSKSDPFKISSVEDLKALAGIVNAGNSCSGQYFSLTDDLTLSDENWTPIGCAWDITFAGTFLGKGHVISGLAIKSDGDYAGLFGCVTGGVESLSVSAAAVSGNNYVGGIAGCNYGEIYNCTFSGTVSGCDYVGGIAGCSGKDACVAFCEVNAEINGSGTGIGGVVGWANNIAGAGSHNDALNDPGSNATGEGLVTECTFTGELTGRSPYGLGIATSENGTITITVTANAFGGIVGWNNGSTVDSCINNGTVNGDDFAGGIVGDSCNGGVVKSCENYGTVTGASMLNGGIAGRIAEGSIEGCINFGAVSGGDFTGGVVGAIDKYSSISGCLGMGGSSVTSADGKYVGGVAGISNCFIKSCGNYGSVTGAYGVGGVVGWTTKDIHTCGNEGAVICTGSEGRVGGIVGCTYGLVENCDNHGNIDGVTNVEGEVKAPAVGGVGGYLFGSMKNCENHGSVTGGVSVGGCAGGAHSTGLISGCTNNVDVSGVSQVGGVIGVAYCLVSDCANLSGGTVTGSDERTGGVIGYLDANGKAEHVRNEGTVIGARYVGGLIGMAKCEVNGLTNDGSVTGGEYAGGIAGYCDVVTACTNNGAVMSLTNGNIGGIVGGTKGSVTSCSNTGNVEGKGAVGGIAGAALAVVKDCTNSGGVNGSDIYTGGIVGYGGDGSEVSGCTNAAAVSGTQYVAGIVAYLYGNSGVSDCRNTEDGTVTGSGTEVGGIVGSASSPVSNCENSGAVSGHGTVGGIAGLSTSDAPIDRCTNTGSAVVTCAGDVAGGILGAGTCTVDNCVNEGSVTGHDHTGGIAGTVFNTGAVRNCRNKGNVTGEDCVGGLVGKIGETADGTVPSGLLENSKNSGAVNGVFSVGGAAGIVHGTVRDCENSGTITGKNNGVGGVVGYCMAGGSVSGCKNLIAFTAGSNISGGVVGANCGTVSGCVNNGEVKGGEFDPIGGIVGSNESNAEITGCTNTATVSGSSTHVGGIAGANHGKITGCANGGQISTTAGLIGGIVGESSGDVADCTNTGNVNARTGSTAYAGGIVGRANGGDITGCSNTAQIYAGEGTGGIVGIISGSKSVTNCTNTGYINAPAGYAGGIVGSLQDNCNVSNCTNGNSVNGNGKQDVGGIVGQAGSGNTISDCVNNGTVSGGKSTGGILGVNGSSGNYTKLTNNGNVTGTLQVGGIVGDCSASVSDCLNTGSITGTGDASGDGVGGIIGRTSISGTTSQCENKGSVVGTYMTGGIVGVAGCNVEKCYNHGNVTCNVGGESNSGVGGIVGYSSGMTISKCVNYAAISGGSNGKRIGGIVGWTSHTNVELCRNYSDVQGYKEAGGIAGYTYDTGNPHNGKNYTTVQKCINTGNVSASAKIWWEGLTLHYTSACAGGIVGKADWYTVIDQCANNNPNAKITAPDGDRVGGIVGYLYNATVQNSYNTAQVSGYDRAGGIVGEMRATSLMQTCFNFTGIISQAYFAGTRGALLGYYDSRYTSPTFKNNYWKHTSALGPINGKGEISSEGGQYDYLDHWGGGKKFKDQSSFTGFDFTSIYTMQSDRPKLQIEPSVPAYNNVGPDENPDPMPKTVRIYTVRNLADLRDKVNSGNYDFSGTTVYLCADLDMSSVSDWTPIGTNSRAYRGTFDGQGHTVYNLKVSGNVGHAGLFGASYALIKNLEVHGSVSSSSNLTGSCVGGVLGVSLGGRVESCSFYGNVSSTGANTYSGGVLGAVSGGGASNCYHVGTVSGSTVGGVTGYIYTGNLENCFHYSGSVTGSKNVGGVIGENVKGTVKNCFALSGTASGAISTGSSTNVGFRSAADFCGSGPIVAGGWSSGVWVAGGDHPEIRALCRIATIDPNGGSGSAGQYGVRRFGGTLPPSPFSRDGYILVGWNTAADGSGTPYNCGDSIGADVTLYAQWLKGTPYHGYASSAAGALFDNNNGTSWTGGAIGSGESTVIDFRSNDAVRPSAIAFVTSGNVCSAPPGWRLEGKVNGSGAWTLLASGDGASLSLAGHVVYANLGSVGDDYYSYYRIVWEGPSSALELLDAYLIVADENVDVRRPLILHSNDGTDKTSPVETDNGSSVMLSNPFDHEGKFFLNWNTAADGSGKTYENYAVITVDGALDLYAQWLDGTHYQKYTALKVYDQFTEQVDGVPQDDSQYKGYENEEYFNLLDGTAAKWCTGVRADGSWSLEFTTDEYVKPLGYVLITADDTSSNSGSNPKNWTLEALSGDGTWIMLDGKLQDQSLPAADFAEICRKIGNDREYNTFRITFRGLGKGSTFQLSELYLVTDGSVREPAVSFDGHGGTGNVPQISAKTGSIVTLPECSFTRKGYDFTEWNTKADGSGKSCAPGKDFLVECDSTLYAQWTPSVYTVRFLGDDGKPLYEAAVTAGQLPVYRGPAPVKEGDVDYSYVFEGWDPVIVPADSDKDYNVKYKFIENVYAEPEWKWSDDHSSATASFKCITDPSRTERVTTKNVTAVTTPATCTEAGNIAYTATAVFRNNNYLNTVNVPIGKLGHAYTVTGWEWNGYEKATAQLTCSRNEDHKSTMEAAVTPVRTEPTCEGTGKIVYTASVTIDGNKYSDQKTETLKATGHAYELTGWDWTGYTEAIATFTCKNDKNHVTTAKATITPERTEPTADDDGKIVYTAEVVFENNTYKDQKTEVIPALGRDYELTGWAWDGYASAEASFTDKNGSGDVTMPADIKAERTEPTCETAGKVVYTATVVLNGKTYTDKKTETLKATGHAYEFTEWNWTGYTEAIATFTCKNDKNHVTTAKATITPERTEPTCEGTGKIVYTAEVTFEDNTYKDQATETLDPIGHAYELTEWNWTGYTEADAVFTCKNDKNHVTTETATISPSRTEPTCEKDGLVVYKASVTFNGKTYTDEKSEILKAQDHDWGKPEYVWSEDDASVTATVICGRDSTHVITETVKTNFVLTQCSTYKAEGSGYYSAVFDNELFGEQIKEVTVPAVSCDGGPTCPSKAFTDVPSAEEWVHITVDWAVVNHVTYGTSATTFSPDEDCTRAQFVTFLWRTVGQPETTLTSSPFKDVVPGTWYYTAVLWAYENHITLGTSSTTFSPDEPCSRSQVVTFLWRMEGCEPPAVTETKFEDVVPGEWYYDAVLWAIEKGITQGVSETAFCPDDTCTRVQCVTFIFREFAR